MLIVRNILIGIFTVLYYLTRPLSLLWGLLARTVIMENDDPRRKVIILFAVSVLIMALMCGLLWLFLQ